MANYFSDYFKGRRKFAVAAITAMVLVPSLPSVASESIAEREGWLKRSNELVGELVEVPGGEFTMGSETASERELPIRTVSVMGFSLQATEVTRQQYFYCVADGRCLAPRASSRARPDSPVVNVSYEDVLAYIQWLNEQNVGWFRLPSEAEWEYAARAGGTAKYSWGDEIDCTRAAYACDGRMAAAEVGSFAPNSFGLFDMSGNVWEWVADCWNENYLGAPRFGIVWLEGDCSRRVVRGGSWFLYPSFLTVSYRDWRTISDRVNSIGFRLVRELPPS